MKGNNSSVSIYKYAMIKNGSPVVRFSDIYDIKRDTAPILSFYGLAEDNPDSIPIYEHENEVSGTLVYSASPSLDDGLKLSIKSVVSVVSLDLLFLFIT